MKTVIGLYDKRDDAHKVIQALVDAGFPRDKISMAAQSEDDENIDLQRGGKTRPYDADKDRDRKRTREAGNEAGEGAAVGGGVGAILGGIGGLLVGLGTLVIPGLGVIAAAGPLAGALAGALAGGAAGGIVGALIGLGIPEEEAVVYEEGVRRGGTLVVLQTEDNRVNEAQSIMERYNPVNIEERAERWRQEGWQPGKETDRTRHEERRTDQPRHEEHRTHRTGEHIEEDIVEEELHVGKRDVDQGGVRLRSHVSSEPVEEDVELRREHVDVERVDMDRELRPGDYNFQEGDEVYELHETDEEPVVEKRARVTGQVRAKKDIETQRETVRDELHRKDVEVESLGERRGDIDRTGTTADMDAAIDQYMREHEHEFRRHYESNLANTGRDFSYYRPAYAYGCKLAQSDQYSTRDWQEIEEEARRRWRETNDDESWRMVEDAVRTSYRSCKM
jgi:stress response protein YsnF